MFKVGPNPYGICFTLGIQGSATQQRDVEWYVGLAESIGAKSIEFHFAHLAMATDDVLSSMAERLNAASIEPVISGPAPLSRIPESFPLARRLGVRTIRTHLSPILCGARAAEGAHWAEIVSDVRRDIKLLGPLFADEGLVLAIENHQDFGSDELLGFCELGGESVGICLDTGNPLAVGEEPRAFAAKVASKVRHIHLKDYRAQQTDEGFRLVRCPIGDGAIPFAEIEQILSPHRKGLTATLEPGALQARHVRILATDWWQGYAPRQENETVACFAATKRNAIQSDEDWRTPFERGDDADSIAQFEMDQFMKSVKNMKSMGWLPA